MIPFLLRRMGLAALLLFVVSVITFLLVSLSPTDVAYTLLGAYATPEAVAALRESLGLDQPLLVRYGEWLVAALQGDLGTSLINQQPVLHAVGSRVEPTISLLVGTIIVTGVAGIGLGVLAALRGGAAARAVDAVGLIGVAVPGFLIGLLLIIVFAVQLRWLPFGGYVPLSRGVEAWALALVLPVLALALGSAGLIAKQVRASMVDALNSEFVLTFTANGFSRGSIVFRHALRSAAVPVVAVLGVTFVGLLGGSVIIEQAFGIPGLGGLAVQSTIQNDLPVVQGVAVVYAIIVIVINLLVDLLFAVLNPKVSVR